jgi:hypothetical protein
MSTHAETSESRAVTTTLHALEQARQGRNAHYWNDALAPFRVDQQRPRSGRVGHWNLTSGTRH